MTTNYVCREDTTSSCEWCEFCKLRLPADKTTLAMEIKRYQKRTGLPLRSMAAGQPWDFRALHKWAHQERMARPKLLKSLMDLIVLNEVSMIPGECKLYRVDNT